jgi:hypothetical protein
MKRFLTIAGLIVAMVAVFVGLALWRMRSERPDLLLEKLRLGKGDKDVLNMKFNLARGDTVPLMAEAFRAENADPAFRVDMLELLFKRYNRSGDERILPVLKEALKHSDATIRKTAVTGFDLYGSDEQRLLLIDSLDDPDAEIRRKVLVLLSSESSDRFREGDRPYDEMWSSIPEEKRLTLVGKCKEKMSAETEEELRFLARAVVGREIEFLGNKAHQAAESGDFEKGEGLVRQALALDAENHQARIRLVRHLMMAGMREKALETAEEYGALLHIPLLAEAPAIDGDPTEEAWKSAYRYVDKPFYHTTSRWAPKQVEGKTDFYIGHRDGAVYVAVIGYEDDLSKLTVKHKERDSQCFLDDCVELFFDPDNSESEVYQFVINPIGALFDGYMTRDWENMVCDWKAQVFHDRGYWSCEFAIEAKNMHGRKIAADSVWGINIARARIGPASEYCAWWPTFGWAHRYDLFPLAVFEGLGTPAGAVGKAATETQDGQLTTFRAPFNAPMDCCLSRFCGPREEPPASGIARMPLAREERISDNEPEFRGDEKASRVHEREKPAQGSELRIS